MSIGFIGIGFSVGCAFTLIYEWFWLEKQKKNGLSYEEMYNKFWRIRNKQKTDERRY